jgi:hypothetical protein
VRENGSKTVVPAVSLGTELGRPACLKGTSAFVAYVLRTIRTFTHTVLGKLCTVLKNFVFASSFHRESRTSNTVPLGSSGVDLLSFYFSSRLPNICWLDAAWLEMPWRLRPSAIM